MKKQRNAYSKRKTQKNSNSFLAKLKKLTSNRRNASVIVVLVLAIGLFTVAVKNVPGLNPFQTGAIPAYRICDIAASVKCFNRSGGGTKDGTNVIAWPVQSDDNNDFKFVGLPNYCDHGKVRAPLVYGPKDVGCPFTSATMNKGNHGRYIFEIQTSVATGINPNAAPLCMGDSNINGAADLGWCPNSYGQNGSLGTIFITMAPLSATDTQLVNVLWSDLNYPVGGGGLYGRYVCTPISFTVIYLTHTSADAANNHCYFRQINYVSTQ
jgi:hypothetical protein